jgi:hypothetical protein
MLFALLGKYDPTAIPLNFQREKEIMEDPPPGVAVIARYARVGGRGGFIHIVEAKSAEQLGALLLKFVDLVEYEIIPLIEIRGAIGEELVEEHFLEHIPMHGSLKTDSKYCE